jgi:putative membrane-bound dehydrogenase-like protein
MQCRAVSPVNMTTSFRLALGTAISLLHAIVYAGSAAPALHPIGHGLRGPAGFEASLYAGDDLVHDTFSLTTDHRGRLVAGGPGWVKILEDTDGNGQADAATLFTPHPRSGAHGMYFDAEGLLVSGDQGVWRWRDRDGDDRADGKPELIFRALQGEHGAHGLVKGPDGWFYLMAGNEADISAAHATMASSPIRDVVAGAIVRFMPGTGRSEIIAHGFRNAYDLDFHPAGNILTFDSDGERDHHLPWYVGTRIFDVALGAHHGWVLKKSPHAWSRPAAWFDTTPPLVDVGRGSPSGVTVYRHRTFPGRYRDGLFALCWTLGRVYFSPLRPEGASFQSGVETFIEAAAGNGFAPVDAVVGPSGDLFVAIGGRGTRGSIFRIRYTGQSVAPAAPKQVTTLESVLSADQPLSSWARASWVPAARGLGAAAFEAAAGDRKRLRAERIRALEILVELFGGVSLELAARIMSDSDNEVVARLSWALVRSPGLQNGNDFLAQLTRSDDPRIARAAWEAALSDHRGLTFDWNRGLGSNHRFVRTAAALAAAATKRREFGGIANSTSATMREKLSRLRLLGIDRESPPEWSYFELCLAVLSEPTHPREVQLDAIRLLQIGLGGADAVANRPETHDGMHGRLVDRLPSSITSRLVEQIAARFPANDRDIDRELARVLAMLGTGSLSLLCALADTFSPHTPLEDDIHYLIAISRLVGPRPPDVTEKTARALAALPHKMRRDEKEPSRYWTLHVGAMVTRAFERDSQLERSLIATADFRLPEHVLFAERMSSAGQLAAARKLLATAERTHTSPSIPFGAPQPEPWSVELVKFLQVLPAEEIQPVFREVRGSTSVMEAITAALALRPDTADRDRLIGALTSLRPHVVERAADALAMLEVQATPAEMAVAIRALRQQCVARSGRSVRDTLCRLLAKWSGQNFAVEESVDLLQSYAAWFAWFEQTHPAERVTAQDDEVSAFERRLSAVDWSSGDPNRGNAVYQQRLCLHCHGRSRIGPELAGVATRLSRQDLFAAITDPSRDISPAWQGQEFTTKNGTTYVGVVIYESPTAKLIQTGPDTTVRITGNEIATVNPSRISLMPGGLLNGLTDQELADLYAFLLSKK